MEIKYSEKSVKQLMKIHKGNRTSAEAILETIESYAKNLRGPSDIKILRGKMGDLKRLRTQDYWIIFEDDGATMLIYEIKHRKEAYR